MKLQRLIALVKKDLRYSTREPAILFLLLLFPVMVTMVFGIAFGGIGSGGTTSFDIGIVNMDTTTAHETWSQDFIGNLTELNGTVVHYYNDNETGQSDLLEGNLDAFIVIPAGFGDSCNSYWLSPIDGSSWINTTVELYVDSGSMIAGGAVPPMVQQVLLNTLFGETATSLDLPIELASSALVAASTTTTWDFMAPGIFAFAAIFMTMTVAQSMTNDRDKGLLKRMATTPVSSSEYMLSQTLSNMVIAIAQVGMVFLSAYIIGYRPDTDIAGLIFAFMLVTAFSLVAVGFGLISAVLSKSAEVATGISFAFIMPQMFFGTFMPLGGLSETIGTFMPSNYVTHALTTLFLRGAPLGTLSIWIDLLVVAAVGVLVMIIGIVLFGKKGFR
ncbi:MAG: ABC transporter permease [Candidatus Thorarchaeota archaeon]|jgi:ABC-2 type transport system permease protein